jgi:hypothetical protein
MNIDVDFLERRGGGDTRSTPRPLRGNAFTPESTEHTERDGEND